MARKRTPVARVDVASRLSSGGGATTVQANGDGNHGATSTISAAPVLPVPDPVPQSVPITPPENLTMTDATTATGGPSSTLANGHTASGGGPTSNGQAAATLVVPPREPIIIEYGGDYSDVRIGDQIRDIGGELRTVKAAQPTGAPPGLFYLPLTQEEAEARKRELGLEGQLFGGVWGQWFLAAVVTPDQAQIIRGEKFNFSNRNIRRPHVMHLKLVIQNGEWWLTHQGGAIGLDDKAEGGPALRVFDFQHRLSAVAEGEFAVPIIIHLNLAREAARAVDQGKKRTDFDALTFYNGVNMSRSTITLAKRLVLGLANRLAIRNGVVVRQVKGVPLRAIRLELKVEQIFGIYDRYAQVIEFVETKIPAKIVDPDAPKGPGGREIHVAGIGRPAVRAAIAVAYFRTEEGPARDRIAEFCDVLVFDKKLDESQHAVIGLLRRQLRGFSSSSRRSEAEIYGLTQRAVQLFLANESREVLHVPKQEIYEPLPADFLVPASMADATEEDLGDGDEEDESEGGGDGDE